MIYFLDMITIKKKKNSFAFRPFLKKDVLKKILKDKKKFRHI